jgi:S1/P1 Nuclease
MKLSSITQTVGLLGSFLPSAYAWGGLGHETVAFIASSFVDQQTQNFFQGILGDTSPEYLAKVATWADSYRYTKAGRFSEPFHFIDSKDTPPDSCTVSYKRDCGSKGCSIEAVQNYVRFRIMVRLLKQLTVES